MNGPSHDRPGVTALSNGATPLHPGHGQVHRTALLHRRGMQRKRSKNRLMSGNVHRKCEPLSLQDGTYDIPAASAP